MWPFKKKKKQEEIEYKEIKEFEETFKLLDVEVVIKLKDGTAEKRIFRGSLHSTENTWAWAQKHIGAKRFIWVYYSGLDEARVWLKSQTRNQLFEINELLTIPSEEVRKITTNSLGFRILKKKNENIVLYTWYKNRGDYDQ